MWPFSVTWCRPGLRALTLPRFFFLRNNAGTICNNRRPSAFSDMAQSSQNNALINSSRIAWCRLFLFLRVRIFFFFPSITYLYCHCMHIHYGHQTHESRVAILECHCDNEEFHPDVTPIILAAQRNDFTLVQVRDVHELQSSKKVLGRL